MYSISRLYNFIIIFIKKITAHTHTHAYIKYNYHLICSYVVILMIHCLLGCSAGNGIQGGSVTQNFAGLDSVTIVSPTAVNLKWKKQDGVSSYIISEVSSTAPISTTVFDSYVVEGLTPGKKYRFKVTGILDGKSYGNDVELEVTMWDRFQGIDSVKVNDDGSVLVSWNYDHPIPEYHLYYSKNVAPDITNTANWTKINLTTTQTTALIKNLDPSNKYYFMIHCLYRTNETEISTKTISLITKANFQTPKYFLPSFSVDNVPYVQFTPIEDSLHTANYFKSSVYWNDQLVSDPLVGAGNIVFSSSIKFPIGQVSNLKIHIEYNDGLKSESMDIEGLTTYIKAQSRQVEIPAKITGDILSSGGSASMGFSITTGDFNCDGYDDVAIGLPFGSIDTVGSKYSNTGAIYVYYTQFNPTTGAASLVGGTPSLNPVRPGVDPQIIAFDDLNINSYLGFSLSSGNINGDSNSGKECIDLLAGAPGVINVNSITKSTLRTGAAFLFYGSPQGLKSMIHASELPENIGSCDGKSEGATCSAVKLWPNPGALPIASYTPTANSSGLKDDFGYSVSVIGDFNADGYSDIAIGAPNGAWDGDLNKGIGSRNQIENVGYVTLYFGSKYGLGTETPLASDLTKKFPYVKIYPPIPLSGMEFGAAVSGGGDVDGTYPVLTNGKYNGGSDLVIGAPGFVYNDFATFYKNSAKYPLYDNSKFPNAVFMTDPGWMSGTTNLFGLTTSNTGIAYIYFGMGDTSMNTLRSTLISSDWWKCSDRGMGSLPTYKHFSCLANDIKFKALTPRDTLSNSFGSAVTIIGDNSHWIINPSNNTPIVNTFNSDTNQDGYADIIVLAQKGSGYDGFNVASNSGNIWSFYGNPYTQNSYTVQDFDTAFAGSGSNAAGVEYKVHSSTTASSDFSKCSAFVGGSNANTKLCVPIVIKSTAVQSNMQIGSIQNSIAVADISGDGIKDLIVGNPFDNSTGTGAGSVLAYISANKINNTTTYGLTNNVKKIYSYNTDANDKFGSAVAAGNINGDSFTVNGISKNYNDIVVGAPYSDKFRKTSGAAFIFQSPNGQFPSVVNTETNYFYDTLALYQDYGLESTRIVGDINGDGYDDAVSVQIGYDDKGAPETQAIVFYGSSLGLVTTQFCLQNKTLIFKNINSPDSLCLASTSPALDATNNDIMLPQLIKRSSVLSSNWAKIAYNVGDINNDGFDDVAFISPKINGDEQLVVYYGSRGGLQAVQIPTFSPTSGDPQIVTNTLVPDGNINNPTWYLQSPMIYHGDFNKDGYSDIVIANPIGSSPQMKRGGIDWPPDRYTITAYQNYGYDQTWSGQGWYYPPTSATACPDCLAGRPVWSHGWIAIIYGSKNGLQTPKLNDLSQPDLSINSNSLYSQTGSTPIESCTATNPNGTDPACNYAVLRNPVFENVENGYNLLSHSFGANIAIGDFDRDGSDDIAVSAPYFQDLTCVSSKSTGGTPTSYGRVYLFFGGNTGVTATQQDTYYSAYYKSSSNCPVSVDNITTPNTGDPALGQTTDGAIRAISPAPYKLSTTSDLNKYFTNRHFGSQITSADVNGDGYEDLIITSTETFRNLTGDDVQGVVYVYYGPLCAADNFPDVTNAIQSYPNTVSASDPDRRNLQGFFASSDPTHGNAPFLIDHIDPSILSNCYRSDHTLKPPPQKFYIKGAPSNINFGYSLGSNRKGKSDFNGDGIDDIVVGTPYYSDPITGNQNVGQGVILFGHNYGLFTNDYPIQSISQNSNKQVRPYLINPPFQNDQIKWFEGNMSFGDVNKDGTMDFMVPSKNFNGNQNFNGVNIGTFFIFY